MSKIKFFTKIILFTAALNLASQAFAEENAKENKARDFNKEMERQIKDFEKWSEDFDKRTDEFRNAILKNQKGFFDDSFFIGDFDRFENIKKNHEEVKHELMKNGGFIEEKQGKKSDKSSQFTTVTQKEDEKSLSYQIDFKGFKKDEINVEVKNGYLTFSAVRKNSVQDKKDKKQSNFTSSFYYSFSLPNEVDTAKYEVLKDKKRVVVKFAKIIPQNKAV